MRYSGSPVVELSVAGELLRFEQDNGSMHVGTSVWESSLVVVKWAERCLDTGLGSCPRMQGKRVVELGTGCGVAGLGLALLGCNVTLTDIQPVMPALKRNVKKNVAATSLGGKAGKVRIAQLYWGNEKQVEALKPPFDLVVATDVVYLEDTVKPLLATMSALAGPETVVVLGYQMRSPEAHELFWRCCPDQFSVTQVPRDELHPDYAFPENSVYILKKRLSHLT